MGKLFANYIFDKVIVSKTYLFLKVLEFSNKKTNNPI